MSLSYMLQQAYQHDSVIIEDGWGQGRATYGGLIAGLLYRHMLGTLHRQLAEDAQGRVLRSVSVSFIGVIATGNVTLQTEIFRSGKSVTQAEARLIQDGNVQAVMVASFGRARTSKIVVPATPACQRIAAPETLSSWQHLPGIMPDFLQYTELKQATGAMPFTGASTSGFAGWMRWREIIDVMDESCLLALIDAWPPSVLCMFKTIAPASTLSWTVEFVGDIGRKTSADWWQYQVATDIAHDGYAHTEAQIYDDAGQLVAISRQVVTVFA